VHIAITKCKQNENKHEKDSKKGKKQRVKKAVKQDCSAKKNQNRK
jgi:hypothetical protein